MANYSSARSKLLCTALFFELRSSSQGEYPADISASHVRCKHMRVLLAIDPTEFESFLLEKWPAKSPSL